MKVLMKCLFKHCTSAVSSIVLGNLNSEKINWVSHYAPVTTIQYSFLNCVTVLGFEQLVTLPTRGDNILDIVLCNNTAVVTNVKISEQFTKSCDHFSVCFTGNYSVLPSITTTKSRDKSNYLQLTLQTGSKQTGTLYIMIYPV